MFFARIRFNLTKNHTFQNLSASPVELFTLGTAKCVAKSDTRGNRNVVILEYGGFESSDAAYEAGIRLVRQIKFQMIKNEISINISGGAGLLDRASTYYQSGVVTEYGMAALRNGALFGEVIPESIQLENDYVGLKVFEVAETLNEIRFIAQEIELSTKSDFALCVPVLNAWDNQMDISLSLLNTSIGINDSRLTFLLRLMAVEALVSAPQSRDADYIEAIDILKSHIDSLEICAEYKQMLKSQLGQFKEQSISQKASNLLKRYLSGKTYADMEPHKLFSMCYRARSSFVHSGVIDGVDIGTVNMALKQMTLDLLLEISKKP